MVAYGFKKQFCAAIELGLRPMHHFDYDPEVMQPKRQTIRAIGKRRHARPGETLQLYTAMRTKQCRKMGEAVCKKVEPIRISVHGNQVILPEQGRILDGEFLDDFARDDGFRDWPGMKKFWLDEHGAVPALGPFIGILITWERIGA